MKIKEIEIHDSLLLSVIEKPKNDSLTFVINYPYDWENQKFAKAELIFEDVINYEVHEGPFAGEPTLLELKEIGNRKDFSFIRKQFKIETNAGYRTLFCSNIKLKKKM